MSLIQERGFPILISIYLLHQLETKLVAIHEDLLTSKMK
ncbi:MAG TPA: YvrJ family protein [Sporosarcina psychrophila]|uniref:YvrJ family protein n=1 Tax=Sporosarcina psychrophila TaxID=1476 RepID=A0A921KEM5_SPOPS|nr:YvrJ family protein [Sporosarcina psychrophila]